MPFEKIRKILGKERILNWNHDSHPGIVWRFPDPGSQKPEERDTNKFDAFQVKIGERAISLINNEFYDDTPPGIYWLKRDQKKGIEVIFVDQGQRREKWGIPSTILTKDDQSIGAHGNYIFRITNPKNFVLSIVSSQRAYSSEQVNDFIKGYVADVLRQHMTNYTILDGQLLRQREEYVRAVRANCQELFTRWGLELINMEVEPHIPEDLLSVIKQKQQVVGYKVTKEAEKQKLEADYDVEKQKLESQKNIDLLRRQVEINSRQSTQILTEIDVEVSKLQSELLKINVESEASRKERMAQAESLRVELEQRANIAADLLRTTTDAELRIKQLEADYKGKASEAQINAWRDVEKARAEAQSMVSKEMLTLQFLKQIEETQAKIAEAIAIGGAEGQALRSGLEEKLAGLITKMGIDMPEYERAKRSGNTSTSELRIEEKIEQTMKQCINCRRTLQQDAKFCDSCGTKQ